MKLLVVDNAEVHDAQYNEPLVTSLSQLTDVAVINYRDSPQVQLEDYTGIILSGVPKNYAFSTIDSRLEYTKHLIESGLPVLGICLGHQNIGRLFGSRIIKAAEAEEGIQQLQVQRSDPLMDGMEASIFASHRGSISLPDGFIQLAATALCRNQIMRHATQDIYGVQFHPELSANGVRLLANFVDIANSESRTIVPDERTLSVPR